jgi:CxxC motif-containing protein
LFPQETDTNPNVGWKLSKDKDGIQVFTRQIPDGKLKEFLAITEIKAPKEVIVNIINDVENKPNWMPNLTSAKIIKQVNKKEHIDYYESEIPWPIRDKDIVMRFKQEEIKDSSLILISYRGEPDYMPEKENISRLKSTEGYFKLSDLGNGLTEIEYMVSSDPEIRLPAWAINKLMVDPPFQTLFNLRKLSEKGIQ